MNQFKSALGDGRAQIGLWAALASPYAAELCAGAGFDWLVLDGEHAPNDVPMLLAALQAVAPYPVEPVVRPPVGDPVLLKQLLDIGARTLLIPMVESAEQAAHLVAATRYPPDGFRGVGAAIGRASRWTRRADYNSEAAGEICLLLQVETVRGLEALDEIARVPGVDGVFIGPSDLAASMGHLGNNAHADVQGAIERAIARILAAGKAPGILTMDESEARRYLELGARFVAVGADILLLVRAADELARRFKASGGNDPAGARSGGY